MQHAAPSGSLREGDYVCHPTYIIYYTARGIFSESDWLFGTDKLVALAPVASCAAQWLKWRTPGGRLANQLMRHV